MSPSTWKISVRKPYKVAVIFFVLLFASRTAFHFLFDFQQHAEYFWTENAVSSLLTAVLFAVTDHFVSDRLLKNKKRTQDQAGS